MDNPLEIIKKLIKESPPDQFSSIIDSLNIGDLPDDSFFVLFENLIDAVSDENLETLIDLFNPEYESVVHKERNPNVVTKYYLWDKFQPRIVERIHQQTQYKPFLVIDQLAVLGTEPLVSRAIERIYQLGENFDENQLDHLHRLSLEYRNDYLEQSLNEFYPLSGCISKPMYVKDLGLNTVNILKSGQSEELTLTDIINIAHEQSQKFEGLDVKLEEPDADEIVMAAQRLILQKDPILRQVMGPVNDRGYREYDPDNICSQFGGCRFLTCCCFECDHPDEEDEQDQRQDWFLGYCRTCKIRIPKRTWALRETMINGGYRHCYCSVKCLVLGVFNTQHIDGFGFDKLDPEEILPREQLITQLPEEIRLYTDLLPIEDIYYLSKLEDQTQQIANIITLNQLYKFFIQDPPHHIVDSITTTEKVEDNFTEEDYRREMMNFPLPFNH